ncbi:MAG: hypothetical protein ACP5T3_03100, partial [Candidatus Micrarchaeia archaeon]
MFSENGGFVLEIKKLHKLGMNDDHLARLEQSLMLLDDPKNIYKYAIAYELLDFFGSTKQGNGKIPDAAIDTAIKVIGAFSKKP